MRLPTAWLTLGVCLFPIGAADDTPRDAGLILRSTTRLVQLNVIAQKGGQPAGGLKKEDFHRHR